MQKQIRECVTQDPSLRQSMIDLHTNNNLVDPLDTCKKLIRILTVDKYNTGAHIDYYDMIDGVDMNTSGLTTCCACPFCTCGENCQCKKLGVPSCDPCIIDISLKKAKLVRNDAVDVVAAVGDTSGKSCCSKK